MEVQTTIGLAQQRHITLALQQNGIQLFKTTNGMETNHKRWNIYMISYGIMNSVRHKSVSFVNSQVTSLKLLQFYKAP